MLDFIKYITSSYTVFISFSILFFILMFFIYGIIQMITTHFQIMKWGYNDDDNKEKNKKTI